MSLRKRVQHLTYVISPNEQIKQKPLQEGKIGIRMMDLSTGVIRRYISRLIMNSRAARLRF